MKASRLNNRQREGRGNVRYPCQAEKYGRSGVGPEAAGRVLEKAACQQCAFISVIEQQFPFARKLMGWTPPDGIYVPR